jgi:hypothetical protein
VKEIDCVLKIFKFRILRLLSRQLFAIWGKYKRAQLAHQIFSSFQIYVSANTKIIFFNISSPETSYTYAQFQKTGKLTAPATVIPRFRKYAVEDFHFLTVLGKGSFGKVSHIIYHLLFLKFILCIHLIRRYSWLN